MAKKDKHIIVDGASPFPFIYNDKARLNMKILEIKAATDWKYQYYAPDFFTEYAQYLINKK